MEQQQVSFNNWKSLINKHDHDNTQPTEKKNNYNMCKRSIKDRFYIDETRYITRRESQVFYYLMKGIEKKEIHMHLGIEHSSTNVYILNVIKRLGVNHYTKAMEELEKCNFINKFEEINHGH